ncbi:Toxoplasma gondii family A protein [Toxoplasma gondii GAB2-2007-GAL-DOM2]|uniref:Toxoplasma gondii family A protein n=4 Tax=Toxoplasma gondii TaxID=5811 RepID=S7W8F2_TOXGG|nr:Toxoplasma gondii family A protein [Toxoplasma gondii GT1]KAF4638935.1 Toxoplasma gondii family A protein [Toxoplasma gondii]KFG34569.1 Toxoplasma gondii family A protein [Toxoplasma gondii GAB2-2007-GAL-DOM2]RQX70372.1 Toxoplasma gondii family A protein [Toxoplasma gondii CAST]
MKGYIFRAACLTLLVGAALSCVATESSDPKTEADFTATIPKGGLEKNVEKVFNLGPSRALQVIDETDSVVYLREKIKSSGETVADRFSAAYEYENGACGFTKRIKFNGVFPGYATPLWVVEELTSATRAAASNAGTSTSTSPTSSTSGQAQEEESTKPQGQDDHPVAPNPPHASPSSEGSVPGVQDHIGQE